MKFYWFRVFKLADGTLLRNRGRALNQSEVGMALVNETADIAAGERIVVDPFRVMAVYADRNNRLSGGDTLEDSDVDGIYFQQDTETFWKFLGGGDWEEATLTAPAYAGGGGGDPDPDPVTYQGLRVNVIRNDSLPQSGKTVYDNAGVYAAVSTYWTRGGIPANDNAIMAILHEAIGAIGSRYARVDTADIAAEITAENWNPEGYVVLNILVDVNNTTFDWNIDGSSQNGTGEIGQFDNGTDPQPVVNIRMVTNASTLAFMEAIPDTNNATPFRFAIYNAPSGGPLTLVGTAPYPHNNIVDTTIATEGIPLEANTRVSVRLEYYNFDHSAYEVPGNLQHLYAQIDNPQEGDTYTFTYHNTNPVFDPTFSAGWHEVA